MQFTRYLFALPVSLCALTAQSQIARFDFDDTVSSVQPAFATVSDLTITNDFVYGGGQSDRWLCLTNAWNNTGGTISFTVTPNAGESIDYGAFRWASVTNNASLSDSVSAVTVRANGSVVGVVDPILPSTVHVIDLTSFAALQGNAGAVLFEMDFIGNPTGQTSYEIGFLEVTGDPCVLAVNGATPAELPIVTSDCFTITGDCLDLVSEVRFDGVVLAESAPGVFGDGSFEKVDPNTLKVCPPLCLDAGTYEIRVSSPNGAFATTTVELVLSPGASIACPATHPAGSDLCVYVSSGQLPTPNAIFVILSPSNVPSVIPGLIEASIGNMFNEYFCGPPKIGECVEDCYPISPALSGTTWYFQAIVWNPFQTILPLPVSNTCSTVIL